MFAHIANARNGWKADISRYPFPSMLGDEMTTRLARLSARVALAVALCGCGKTASSSNDLPPSDPYMQALYATMNYTACKLVRRPQPSPTERERLDAAVSAFEVELARAEAAAASAGQSDYIKLGQQSFRRRLASELHAGCRPNETEAGRDARSALERFRRHTAHLGPGRR
jgi:hypothetical protein